MTSGEIEKDFEFHEIEAESIQDAVNKVERLYNSHASIPFAFYHDNNRYEPNGLTKNDIFNLTTPEL